jgi:ABC-type nitrate/sulfonate/bicarbonate transport system substrate-binding protein
VNQNPEVLRRFQRAYAKGADYTMKNKPLQAEWQVKYFRLKPELKDQIPPYGLYQDTDLGRDFQASLIRTKDLMVKYKFLDSNLDPLPLIFK